MVVVTVPLELAHSRTKKSFILIHRLRQRPNVVESDLAVDLIIQRRENIISRFDLAKPLFVDVTRTHVVVQVSKALEMLRGAVCGVMLRGFLLNEKGPITGLGK